MKLESSMHARNVPWFGIGTEVEEAPTAEEAIRKAGLDWKVIQRPVYCDGMLADNRVGNVRVQVDPETGEEKRNLLGIVSKDYHPVQNREAFGFFDSLIGTEARYETAGSIGEGRRIFLTAKMSKDWKVGDDDIDTYLLLSNGHDGGSALRAAVTPVRVVCQNTLNLALKKAERSWAMRHSRDIKIRLREAQEALGLTAAYMSEFVEFGNRATDTKVSAGVLEGLVKELFPTPSTAQETERAKKNREERISAFENCLYAPDLTAYRGTLWGVLNAVSDYETHKGRQTATLRRVVNGRLNLLSKAQEFLLHAI